MRNADDSYIETGKGGTAFVGQDATALFAAVTLRSAIKLYVNTGLKANRAYTASAMAAAAGRVTGKKYKTSKPSLTEACADLTEWINAMKAALPVIDGRGK